MCGALHMASRTRYATIDFALEATDEPQFTVEPQFRTSINVRSGTHPDLALS
ncbi:MAG: hypothetical protein ACI9W2_004679, partial [Gammaproteobacteria bacterium]